MKMKRLLAWLLVLVMCFMLAACGKDTEDESNQPTTENSEPTTESTDASQSCTATPLLYRVTDESGNIIWLFGSIHVGRENYYPLPDYVQNAFENADSLAVELDIVAFEKDLSRQMKALTQLVYRDGSTIQDHIPKELYEKSVEILKEYKSYAAALDYYCPAFWSSAIESVMLEELGGNANFGIDVNLINQANKTKKEILEIESAEFQYKMLASFEDDIQLMLLESAVELYGDKAEAAGELEDLMNLWASGDESAFEAYLKASDDTMTDEEKKIYEKYDKIMVTDRNLTMADYAEDALASGKEVFICVGAAHIVGDGAVVELLSHRGYRVECITK